MQIKEIELYNFRIYHGTNKIVLENNGDKNISIISGRNGFGKTTFLMSLVWCLYGKQMQEVDDIYKKEINDQGGYAKYIVNSLNRMAKQEEDYNFHVSITFSDVRIQEIPCKEITIKRSFNTKTSGSEDDVEVLIDGYQNEIAKEVGPNIFIREFILPIEIAKFFFFDAEKIVNLAEVNSIDQRKNLNKAYSEVLGIKKYEDLRSELEDLQIALRRDSASTKERAEFDKLQVDVDLCDKLILEKEERIVELKETKTEKLKASRDIQEKLIRVGSVITVEELNELKQRESELISKQEQIQDELKTSYEIIPFAIAAHPLLEVYNQLEAEAKVQEFSYKQDNISSVINDVLTDLSNIEKPKDLIIHYPIQEFYNNSIRSILKKRLQSEDLDSPEQVDILHEFSETNRRELNSLLQNLKISFTYSFKKIVSEFNLTRNELNSIRKKVRDAEANQEDPIITSLRESKSALDLDILTIESSIETMIREIGELSHQKVQKNKEIESLSRKIKVSDENVQKDKVLTKSIQNLKTFIAKYKIEKKESLQKQILEGLRTLLHKKDFITKVDVDILGEDIDIVLYNNNVIINKEGLSKGEQQMYATALLRGLVEESNIEFPVFIDSPMQKFDEQHAKNIVNYFYPNVSDQVVIFPLVNKELNSKEYDILLKKISRTYLIDNIHIDKSQFIEVKPNEFLATYNKKYNNAD